MRDTGNVSSRGDDTLLYCLSRVLVFTMLVVVVVVDDTRIYDSTACVEQQQQQRSRAYPPLTELFHLFQGVLRGVNSISTAIIPYSSTAVIPEVRVHFLKFEITHHMNVCETADVRVRFYSYHDLRVF